MARPQPAMQVVGKTPDSRANTDRRNRIVSWHRFGCFVERPLRSILRVGHPDPVNHEMRDGVANR